MERKVIGRKLARDARGKRTQKDFSEELGIARPMVSDYERGAVEPSVGTWLKMADLAGFPINRDIWEYLGFDREKITAMFKALRDRNDATPGDRESLEFKKSLNELSKAEPVTEGLLNDRQPPEAYSKTVEEFWERNKFPAHDAQTAKEVKPKHPKKKGKPRKKGKT